MYSLVTSALIAVAIVIFSIAIGFKARTWILGGSIPTVSSLDLPLGYSIASVLLVLSMKLGAGLTGGSWLLSFLVIYALAKLPRSAIRLNRGRLLPICIAFSFVVAVGAAYFPLLWNFGTTFQHPGIFDAPKHIFTITALQATAGWPPQNPFMPELGFAYNFGFYSFPAALIALTGDARMGVSLLPWLAIISAVSALSLTLGVATKLGTANTALPVVALSATWLGGFTPLLVEAIPPMGFRLLTEGVVTSIIWADEPFISAIFVPQHLFAATCVLGAVYLALCQGAVWRRATLAAVLSLAASLSSLILLPHVSATFAAIVLFMAMRSRSRSEAAKTIPVLMTYGAILLPFVIEAARWQSGSGESLIGYPPDIRTTLVVLAGIGPVAVLAIIGLTASHRNVPGQGTTFVLIPVLISAAAAMLLQYSEAGFKSTMLLRTLLPCVAGLGWTAICQASSDNRLRVAAGSFGLICVGLNAQTTLFFAAAPLRPYTQNEHLFLQKMQASPAPLFFNGVYDQWLASLAVKQTIFDFRHYRPDAYLPPADRPAYDRFFSAPGQERPRWLGSHSVVLPSDAVRPGASQTGAPIAEAMGLSLYRLDQ